MAASQAGQGGPTQVHQTLPMKTVRSSAYRNETGPIVRVGEYELQPCNNHKNEGWTSKYAAANVIVVAVLRNQCC